MSDQGVFSRKKSIRKGSPSSMDQEQFESLELEERIALIQELIPLGLMAVAKELNKEVEALVGSRYQRNPEEKPKRYGYNPGSVRLGGRMVPVKVPRVRDSSGEIALRSYELLHGHSELESSSILNRVISGVSTRSMDKTLPESVGSIGTSKSTISRRFTQESQKKLKELQERDLSQIES